MDEPFNQLMAIHNHPADLPAADDHVRNDLVPPPAVYHLTDHDRPPFHQWLVMRDDPTLHQQLIILTTNSTSGWSTSTQ
jgi:hypothetical protein